MNFKELIVLLPCESLETLSLHREGTEAEELLAGWSGLYHPDILARAEGTPKWARAETPPETPGGSLIVIPQSSEPSLPPDWLAQAESSGARLIRGFQDRARLIEAALGSLDDGLPRIDPALAGDFLALGFCHFQVEVLTRQLRYMSNLDEERFRRHLTDAVQSAVQGDPAASREHLRGAFDRLTEAREYFYPVETYLLDLTLAAPTTLGRSLRDEVASGRLINLLISGRTVEQMAQEEPATLANLREGLQSGNVTLIGGEYDEEELPLLSAEGIADQLRRGLAVYRQHLGCRPTVFGRRRFGLTPLLPQILRQFGFAGALHFTLDDGRFPSASQSKIRWEGLDGTEIESLARVPLEAVKPEGYLRLSERLGNTMDVDHAATIAFAHWPGRSSPWYGDLWRMHQYGPVLGRFTTASNYFQSTLYAGRTERHEADKYRSPYLWQEVEAEGKDPISRWVSYHRREEWAHRLQSLGAMAALAREEACPPADAHAAPADAESSAPADSGNCLPSEEALRGRLQEAVARFPSLVSGGRACRSGRGGLLLVNPRSFPRREHLDVSHYDGLPEVSKPVLAAVESGRHKQVLVEVPAMGFAWVGPEPGEASPAARKKARKTADLPPLAEGNVLRNEYFEVTVNPLTGGIQAMHNFGVRANRLAEQIGMRLARPAHALRDVEPGAEEEYSLMAADEVSVEEPGPMVGRIMSRGRLVDREGQLLARFAQTMEARRLSRVLELRIDLEIERQPEPEPWSSYYAARFAWNDETADVYRSVGLANWRTEANFLEAPHFIDIRGRRARMTILPGGLPYHRRFGFRKLDTLLVVRGETARSFRLGIAIDAPYSLPAALDFLAAGAEKAEESPPPPAPSGWFFHVDARNVLATHWEPLWSEGRAAGFRVRLLETEGRGTEVGLRSFRDLASAKKTDLLGESPGELPIAGDRITIDLGPHQWAQVEALFAGCGPTAAGAPPESLVPDP